MSVVSVKELPRTNTESLGQSRTLRREFVVVLSDDTTTTSPPSEILVRQACFPGGVGTELHPNYLEYRLRTITYTEGYEGSPYHVHVSGEYGVVNSNELLAPASRVAVWEFDAAPGEVPALYYYGTNGSGQTQMYPLTNSANDYFPGLTTEESTIAIKITKNFSQLPSSWIAAQNYVNSDTFAGCGQHTVKVRSVNVAQTNEEFNGSLVNYWKATAELHYRQSGHNLQLPDIGWNQLVDGEKRRCMVFDFENDRWIPSPNPVGLDGYGQQTNGQPAILVRRVSPETSFVSLFGSPPTAPL